MAINKISNQNGITCHNDDTPGAFCVAVNQPDDEEVNQYVQNDIPDFLGTTILVAGTLIICGISAARHKWIPKPV